MTKTPLQENLRRIGPLTFLRLEGDYRSRTRMHAQLIKNRIQQGAIPILAKKNEWLIRRAGGPLENKTLQTTVVFFYHHILLPMLQNSLKKEHREIMEIMAQECDMPFKSFLRAMFQADGLMILSRTSMMKYLVKDFAVGQLPACSSVCVNGPWTKGGRLLVARNQDYPIVGPWDSNTLVMFHRPSEKDLLPFVSISSAGLHTGGLTSMNEEGLTVSAHAHFGKHVSVMGQPIFVVGQEIVSRAKNISEAIDVAKKLRRNANWSLVVSSARDNDAAVLEMTPDKLVPRYAKDGFINHTNFFHSPELAKEEAILSPSRMEDDHARWCRMKQILTPHKGQIEVETMTQIMGDHVDPWTNQERIMGNTLSVMSTIKSVVFSPSEQKMWVSARTRSPMGLGPFMPVDITNFWQTEMENLPDEKMFLPGKKPSTPGFENLLDLYRTAYIACHTHPDRNDYLEQTLIHLQKLLALGCPDGHVWVQSGHVAFKLAQVPLAMEYYTHSLKLPLAQHVAQGRDLLMARCLDIEGRRADALLIYERLAKTGQGPLLEAARTGLKKAFQLNRSKDIMVDLQFPDPMHY